MVAYPLGAIKRTCRRCKKRIAAKCGLCGLCYGEELKTKSWQKIAAESKTFQR